jgi:hypothetical protein
MMDLFYSNCSNQEPHIGFIGRWSPLHTGHTWIIEKVYREKDRPVLVLVRSTAFDEYSAEMRAEIVKTWFEKNGIRGSIAIIPDIEGIYYGRGVGYEIEEIEPPQEIRTVSATEIRKMIGEGNEEWKQAVATGTSDVVERIIRGKISSAKKRKGAAV